MAGNTGYDALSQVIGTHALKGGANIETATTTHTIVIGDSNHQKIDPGGGALTITLPAEADSNGAWFEIINAADAAETITVKDDAANTIVVIPQNEKATVICDGTLWSHTGIVTIQLS